MDLWVCKELVWCDVTIARVVAKVIARVIASHCEGGGVEGWNWKHILIDDQLSGCPTPQRIATYSLSPNRQRPLAGAFHAAIFNTFRRCKAQVLYVVPPFVAAYAAMNWATERYASFLLDMLCTGVVD